MEDGSFHPEGAKWLPKRWDCVKLSFVIPFVLGSLLICACATQNCKWVLPPDACCQTCDPGVRNAAEVCCTSIQVLDLKNRSNGFHSIPIPDLHFGEVNMSKMSMHMQGTTLVMEGIVSLNASDTCYTCDFAQMERNWKSGVPVWNKVERPGYLKHLAGIPHERDESKESPLFSTHRMGGALVSVAVTRACDSRLEEDCDPGYETRNAVWVNGVFRPTCLVPEEEGTLRIGYSTCVVDDV